MKIALLIRSLELGGIERQLCLLARSLLNRNHQVHVLVFYGDGPLQAGLEATGVPVLDLDKNGHWNLLGLALRLRAWLIRAHLQVLFSFLDTPNLLAAWLRPYCPGFKVAWGGAAT
ncbi:hypothetical protein DFAR_150008 [Desulfarculales bacterium]